MKPDEPVAPETLVAAFTQRFGSKPRLFRAPGRVNLIGEHTDYNDGLVLPFTIARHTWVASAPRHDRTLEVHARRFGETTRLELEHLPDSPLPGWAAYVLGVAQTLAEAGVRLRGASLILDGDLPLGSGLSSSASLEVALALALLDGAGQSLPPQRLAQLCQRAEHRAAGVPCGIMDQFVIANGRNGHVMQLDCRDLSVVFAKLPGQLGMLVIDSGVKHALRDGAYARRRAECESALRGLQAQGVPANSLRDVSMEQLREHAGTLPPSAFKRARHVIGENRRVSDALEALGRSDLAALGALLSQSHASLRDDFEVSCEELDYLVELAKNTPGVHGARMFGGGFGGCALVLADQADLERVEAQVVRDYAEWCGQKPWAYRVRVNGPAERVAAP